MNPATQERMEGLLYANLFGALTEEERAELYRASLEDQSLFDHLMEAEDLRSALEEERAREQLLTMMAAQGGGMRAPGSEGRVPWWSRWTLAWSLAGAMAAVLAVAAVRGYVASRPDTTPQQTEVTLPASQAPAVTPTAPAVPGVPSGTVRQPIEPAGVRLADPLLQILAWQVQPGFGAEAAVEAPSPATLGGGALGVRVTSPVAARVWLLEWNGDGAPRLATPKGGVLVEANASRLIVLAGPQGAPSTRVRVVALDAGDRLFAGEELDEAGAAAPRTVLDLQLPPATAGAPQ